MSFRILSWREEMRYADFVDKIYKINFFLVVSLIALNIADFVTTLSLSSPEFIEMNKFVDSMLKSHSYVKLFLIKVVLLSLIPVIALIIERQLEDRYFTNMTIRTFFIIFTMALCVAVGTYFLVVINNIQLLLGYEGLLHGCFDVVTQ
jgi:ABC-type multidrug transport system fused ATPase/permease subunit